MSPPLYLHLKRKSAATVARIAHSVNRNGWDGIGKGQKRGTQYIGPELGPISPVSNLNLAVFLVSLEQTDHYKDSTPDYNVYTDGSKFEGSVGSGWIITIQDQLIDEGSKCLPDHCFVFEAEMLAISG